MLETESISKLKRIYGNANRSPHLRKHISYFFDRMKQSQLQQHSQISADDVKKKLRRETITYFRTNGGKIRKVKLFSNNENENITDLNASSNKFKTGYQPISNLVQDEKSHVLAKSHNILNTCKIHLPFTECKWC